jgi:hypothetical protein
MADILHSTWPKTTTSIDNYLSILPDLSKGEKMLIKILKLIAIAGMMLLVVSCNQSEAAKPGTNPNSDQPQSSQADQSNQSQSSQSKENTLSEFQGGITVRDGYDQALPKALEWSPTAVLSEVYETPINLEGKSKSWIYYFADDALKSPEDRSMGFYVIVGENGVTEAKPGNINVGENLLPANIADWQIDTSQALAACEHLGGTELRAANPAIYEGAWLRLYDYLVPNNMPQPTSKNIYWIITYRDPAVGQAMTCEVDGNNGKVFKLSIDLADDTSVKTITALTGYPTALAKAQEWNPDASLLSVSVEYPSDNQNWPIGGVAKYWRYEFIVLPAPSEGDYQPSYTIVVGASGLMNFRAGSSYTYANYGSQADWVIDSDEAFRTSEENGGKDYRDQHSDASFGMQLVFGFYPIDELNTSKNVRWETGYGSETDYENELHFQIDGTNGELVSQR